MATARKPPVAVWVQALRRRMRLSREELAMRLSVSPATIARWETGWQQPSPRARRILTEVGTAHGLPPLPPRRGKAAERRLALALTQALPQRIRSAMWAAEQTLEAFEALGPETTDSARGAAARDYLGATLAMLRELARDPAPGEVAVPPAERRAVVAALLETRERLQAIGRDALGGMVHVAASGPGESEEERADWEYARALLLDNGFLTPAELDSFPLASQIAIVRERFHRWEATGDARG